MFNLNYLSKVLLPKYFYKKDICFVDDLKINLFVMFWHRHVIRMFSVSLESVSGVGLVYIQ